ncbi:2,3-bisphosphoglycerate-dependent phosphoglycerate mutase [uncultured archaeon]|nr:2,3-bisphosphoglycerate-dependent phosphoglycerate mutase [uncultured archaeon]
MSQGDFRIAVFIRHGESVKNVEHVLTDDVEGYPLTALGEASALAAGDELRKLGKIDGFYSSPVLRARQTAGIISRRVNATYLVDGLLKERGMGKYNGMRYGSEAEVERLDLEQIRNNYPDYESWSRLQDRMAEFGRKLKNGTITVAVSHGDPIKCIVGGFLGKTEEDLLHVHFPKASITVVDFARRGALAVLAQAAKSLPAELCIDR